MATKKKIKKKEAFPVKEDDLYDTEFNDANEEVDDLDDRMGEYDEEDDDEYYD